MATLVTKPARPGTRFWLAWMFATIAGVFLYMIVFPPVFNAINEYLGGTRSELWIGIALGAISAITLGATIGAAQWLVLRGHLPRTGWWILATLIGYSMPLSFGSFVGGLEPPWLAGLAMFLEFGVVLGVLQWLVLRGRVGHARWWIAISIAGWAIAAALIDLAYISGLYVEPFDLLAAFLVPVAVAGGGIVWLLRQSVPAIARENLPN